MNRHPAAFTLIELLVVVTIIVILIALLVPSLDQAIYQADLTSCLTKQRAAGSGVAVYVQDNQRAYPHRGAVHAADFWPMAIALGLAENDDRPKLKKYFALNATLNCPLGLKLDIEGSKAASATFAAENMWFGWQYTRNVAPAINTKESGMIRQGDRWEYFDADRGYRLKSKVILGTRYIWNSPTSMASSHPASTYTSVISPDTSGYHYYRWDSDNRLDRGFVDLNFTFSDLSGERYAKVDWDDDERMSRSPPLSKSGGWSTSWEWTPRQ